MKVLFCCCVLIIYGLTSVSSQRNSDLIEKLEELIRDPAFNDAANEIYRPRYMQGMLLKGLKKPDRSDTSSEERFFRILSRALEKISKAAERLEEEKLKIELTTTTTNEPSTIASEEIDDETATITTVLEEKPPRGISSLGSIISRLIGMWRKH